MTDILLSAVFLACYFMFPIVLYFFLKYFKIDVFRFGIESFVVVNLIVFSYIGLLPLYFELDSLRVNTGIRDSSTLAILLACSTWAIFSFSGGLAVAHTAFPASGLPTLSSRSDGLGQGQTLAFALLAALGCVVLVLYLAQVDRIALFSALKGDAAAAARERSLMTNAFSGRYHWYSVFLHEILWCVAAISFASVLTAARRSSVMLAVLSAALMIFTTSMSAQKSQTVIFLLSMYIVYIVAKRSGSYGTSNMLAGIFLATTATVLIYSVIYGISVDSALVRVSSRAFTGQIAPAYFYLSYFPDHHDYLLGRSFPNPGGLLPHEPYRLTVEIMNWVAPQNAERSVVGSAPTAFWGEIYANFGYWGVAIMPFFVGLWVGLVTSVVNAFPRSPVAIGLSVWLAMHFAKLSSTGVAAFIVDFNLALVGLFIGAALLAGSLFDRFYFRTMVESRRLPGSV